jgi:hypothetical protein
MKFNTGALLRMDEATKANTFKTRIDSRTITPNEVREIEDLLPLTPEQIAEFNQFWPVKAATPTPANAGS